MREAGWELLFVKLFPADGADGIARLVERVRARKAVMIEEWRRLCVSNLGAHRALSERLFYETYVPCLRSATESLCRGDMDDFVAFAHALGAQLAEDGVPFAAMVAHVGFLKESCATALADGDPFEASRALRFFDKLASCLVSAAAETYYENNGNGRGAARVPGPYADLRPAPDHAESVAASGFFHGIVGRSPAMQRLFEQVRRVALGTFPVVVLGETGTGKELVARAIHATSARRDAPFIALNCAALPRDLVESELFGYKRGAFSGAVSECLGLFRAAAGGTLLLDEITEMAPDLQAKLLRVLQERTVRPVGGVSEEPVDVRIIASTNRDPETALRSRLLRADLYYRLAVSTIVVPPLRERLGDVVPLVEYRLADLGRSREREPKLRGVTPDAMEALLAQPWPGNVRELFNVVENAFTMCGSMIGVADLGLPPAKTIAPDPPSAPPPPSALGTMQESERTLIAQTLASTQGNKVRAARQLGISRKKLYAKLARYGLMTMVLGCLSSIHAAAPFAPR
jgi:two-component system NtrC family response regulator